MRFLSTLLGVGAVGCFMATDARAATAAEVARAEKLAIEGNPSAQVAYGILHETGDGVPANGTEASKWYRLAAEQGDAEGAFRLGWLYARGEGLPRSLEQAIQWYEKAAAQDHPVAQLSLGWIHFKGEGGIARDVEQAARWFERAAARGDAQAQYTLGLIHSGAYADVPADPAAAFRWFKLAADQGVPGAQFKLGVMYATGDGVEQDNVEAYYWLSRALARLPEGAFKNEAQSKQTGIKAQLSGGELAAVKRRLGDEAP